MLASSIKNIAVLWRLGLIVQHMAIAFTYKIKAAGSWQVGEIMVSEIIVFCGVVFVDYVGLHYLIMMYCMGDHSKNLALISQAHPM